MRHAPFVARLAAGAVVLSSAAAAQAAIISVTATGGDAATTNGPPNGTQVENTQGGTPVGFGEDVFLYTDRSHQANGARFTSAGVLSTATAAGDLLPGIPSYLLGQPYISTRMDNRDNASFLMTVVVDTPVTAYLLIDNRVGEATPNTSNPPTLGSGGTGVMSWVADNGWTQVNTGFSPNGQPDFVGIDEGATATDFNTRAAQTSGLSSGTGNGLNQFFTVYKHDFGPGSFQTFAQNDGTTRDMYSLVVVPEPTTAGVAAVGVMGLMARRRRHGR